MTRSPRNVAPRVSRRWLWLWTLVAGLSLVLLIGVDLWCLGGTVGDWVRPERSLPFFGFVVGALVVAWQLARQHENTLSAQAEEARNALNLEIYRDLAAVAQRAADSSREMITAVMEIQLDLHGRRTTSQASGQIPPARESYREFLGRVRKATSDALDVAVAIEKWEIAFGRDRQLALRRSLIAHVDAARKRAFEFGNMISELIREPEIGPLAWPPSDEMLESVTQAGAVVQQAVFDLVADLHDLRVFTQNGLLGGLFPRRLTPRDPAEPTGKPLTLDAQGNLR